MKTTIDEYLDKIKSSPNPEERKTWDTQLIIFLDGHPAYKAVVITIAHKLVPTFYKVPLVNKNTLTATKPWTEVDQEIQTIYDEIQTSKKQEAESIKAKERKADADKTIYIIHNGYDKPISLRPSPKLKVHKHKFNC